MKVFQYACKCGTEYSMVFEGFWTNDLGTKCGIYTCNTCGTQEAIPYEDGDILDLNIW